jgi:hypothetical protein
LRLLHLAFLTLLLPTYIGGCLFLYKGSDFALAVGFNGLYGTVHAHVLTGPVAPVGTEGLENSAPLEGATIRFETADGEIVASGTTDTEGNVDVRIEPGTYHVRALAFDGRRFPMPPGVQRITITGGTSIDLNLEYDSGIR